MYLYIELAIFSVVKLIASFVRSECRGSVFSSYIYYTNTSRETLTFAFNPLNILPCVLHFFSICDLSQFTPFDFHSVMFSALLSCFACSPPPLFKLKYFFYIQGQSVDL